MMMCFPLALALALQAAPAREGLLDAIAAGRRVMFVGAHPDDETTVGPLLARAAERTKVMVVILTRGEGGENKAGRELDAALGEIRVKELAEACKVLGVEQRNLGFWNGLPHDHDNPEGGRETPRQAIARWAKSGRDPRAELVKVVQECKPDILVSFDDIQGFTGNREHRAAGILTVEAARECKVSNVYQVVNLHAKEIHPRLPVVDEGRIVERIDGNVKSGRVGRTYTDIAMEAWARHESQVGKDVLKTDFAKRMARVIGTTVLIRP